MLVLRLLPPEAMLFPNLVQVFTAEKKLCVGRPSGSCAEQMLCNSGQSLACWSSSLLLTGGTLQEEAAHLFLLSLQLTGYCLLVNYRKLKTWQNKNKSGQNNWGAFRTKTPFLIAGLLLNDSHLVKGSWGKGQNDLWRVTQTAFSLAEAAGEWLTFCHPVLTHWNKGGAISHCRAVSVHCVRCNGSQRAPRNNIKPGTNRTAGSVQLARASSCGGSPHVMTPLLTQCWWQGMAGESRCTHTSLICLFCLGVKKANGLPFNSTIFCFVVGTCVCREKTTSILSCFHIILTGPS